MTGISTVAVVATKVGILGVGLHTEQQSSVTIDTKEAALCAPQLCVKFNCVTRCSHLSQVITNATGWTCVGSVCCSMNMRRREQFRGVSGLHLFLI